MQNYASLFLATLCASSLLAMDQSPPVEAECTIASRSTNIGIRYTSPTGIGYKQGYTTLEGFFTPNAVLGIAWLPFLDLRGHVFDNGKMAANAGFGTRYIAERRIWGMNAYYDYRNTNRQHYNQVAAGLESLGRIWDFRLNGYLPIGKKSSPYYHLGFDSFKGNSMIVSRSRQFAMAGFNAEAGFHLEHFKKAPLTFTAGPYYLVGSGKATWGGELRAAVDLCDRYISLEGHTSYDHFFKWTGQGQISINIPFGARKKKLPTKGSQSCALANILQMRARQRVDRHEIIPIGKQKILSVAKGLTFLFVSNDSHSSGTFEDPYHSLAQAEENSAPGDIIYIFPGDGTTTGYDEGIVLKDNQQLLGANATYTFATNYGPVSVPPQASSTPTISNGTISDSVVVLANGNTVAGLSLIDTKSANAIDGENIENFTAFQNTISSNHYAVNLSNAVGQVILTNNEITLTHVSNAGFFFQNDTPKNLTLSNNTIVGGGIGNIVGVDVEGDAPEDANWTFTGNSFTGLGTDSSAFYFPALPPQAFTVSNNVVGASDGVTNLVPLAQYGSAPENATWLFTGNTFTNVGSYGFDLEGAPLAFTVSNNTITVADGVTGAQCIYITGTAGENATWDFTGNAITNNGNANIGFSFNSVPKTLTLSGNSFVAIQGASVVQINGDAPSDAVWNFTGNAFSEIGDSGLGFAISGLTPQTFTLSNNTITAVDAPAGITCIYLYGDASAGATWTFTGNTFTGLGDSGRGFDLEGDLPQTFTLSNNIVAGSGPGAGVQYPLLITNAAPADGNWNFIDNTFSNVSGNAIQFNNSPPETLNISNNSIVGIDGAANINGVQIQAAVPANANWAFTENTITVGDTSYGFRIDPTSIVSGGVTTWTFDQNTITLGDDSYGIAIHEILPNRVVITNNGFTGVSGGSTSAIATFTTLSQPGYTSCLTLTDNIASPVNPASAGAYQLSQSDGTFNLNESGNTGEIVQLGTIGVCP